MKAIALDHTRRALVEKEVPEPRLEQPGQVLFRVREVGICGTDRDLASFRLVFPPQDGDHLVLGHECVGEVLATASDVGSLRPGDVVVPLVRRPCVPACRWCASGRRDLCSSGRYTERGIVGAHGYFTEVAVDDAADLVPIPANLREFAVLIEPLSVVEKTVANAFRLHPGPPENALVLGAGTIGLLSAMTLRSRGIAVTVASVENPQSERARLVEAAGAAFTNKPEGFYDIVIEAAGAVDAATIGLEHLAPAGVLVILGVNHPIRLPTLQLLVRNQVVVGSVNAAPADFSTAVADLATFPSEVLTRMIAREPWAAFRSTLTGPLRSAPKIVHVLA